MPTFDSSIISRARIRQPCRSHRFRNPLSMSTSPAAADLDRSTTMKEEANGQSSSKSKGGHYDAVIVGGGPAGLLSAIMMAQHLSSLTTATTAATTRPRIIVYDRLPPPPPPNDLVYSTDSSKYYLLGLGHRGQTALRHFNVWDDVSKAAVAVLGRRDWAPGKSGEEDSNIRMANKAVTSQVLPRDKLVGVLKEAIEGRYGDLVELRYGWQVDPVSFGNEGEEEVVEGSVGGPPVTLQISRCIPVASSVEGDGEECSIEGDDVNPATITTDFLIGSDGAARTIANAMETNDLERRKQRNNNPLKKIFGEKELSFHVKRYEDDNPRVYKSIPISFPSHWPHDLNYSARSSDGRVTFEALPSDAHGKYCALMLLKAGDPLAAADCDPDLLRSYFEKEYPQFNKLLSGEVMADVAAKGASALPSFRYAGPRLHEGGRTVILGDCVHTVKPYFGLGANSALEDVQILGDILSNTSSSDSVRNYGDAVRQFTDRRAADSRALVTLSRGLDRPGKLGTMRFVLPLILDGMFHKLAPKLFAPGIFGMFQLEGIGFRQIQRRKRLDRVMQSFVILGGLSAAGVGAGCLVKKVARLLGVNDALVGGSAVALLGAVGVVRGIGSKMKKSGDSRSWEKDKTKQK